MKIIIGAMLGACAIVATPAGARPLGFAETVAAAEARAPMIAAKELERAALLDEAAVAGTRPDPTLSVGVANLPVTGSDPLRFDRDEMTMKSIAVSQEFVRASTRRARAAALAAKASVSAAERQLVATQVRAEAATAWLDLYFAGATEAELRRLRREADLDLAAARAAYAGGSGTQGDVITAEAEIARIDDRLALAARDAAVARARLGRWTGTAVEAVAGPLPALDEAPLEPAHLEHLIGTHPEVAVYAARVREAEAEAESARAERKADWTVEAMYGQRDQGLPDMASVTVRIQLQLNQKGRQDRIVAARRAQAQAADAEREDAVRMHRAEIAAELAAWQAGHERATRYRSSLMPLAQARADAALAAYRGGSGSLAALVAARRARFDVALELLALEAETARSWAELHAIAGTLGHAATSARGGAQ